MLPAVLLIALRCRRLSYMAWQVDKDNISCEAFLMWRIHHLSYVDFNWFHSHFLLPGIINLLQLRMCQIDHWLLSRRIYHPKTTLNMICWPTSQRLQWVLANLRNHRNVFMVLKWLCALFLPPVGALCSSGHLSRGGVCPNTCLPHSPTIFEEDTGNARGNRG